MSTNATIAAAVALMMWLVGPAAFLKIHGPVFMLSATIGVWLFYVQHQFEGATWANDKDWSFTKAALNGSSLYDLPIVLSWFSANIGVHHVHHLASRIPFYRLPEVLRDFPELAAVGRLTLRQSLACVNFALWDEDARRLISFRTLRKQLRTSEIRSPWRAVTESGVSRPDTRRFPQAPHAQDSVESARCPSEENCTGRRAVTPGTWGVSR